MTRLVLVHGWGLTAHFWDGLRAALPQVDALALEAGADGGFECPALPPGPLVAVGHSLGSLWLLHARPFAWAGLVCINGFTRFTRAEGFPNGVPPRVLARMRARFTEDPEGGHAEFLRRCGHPHPSLTGLSVPALTAGLDALAAWDGRAPLGGPRLALAGRQDPIVPPAMSQEAFEGWPLAWHEEGGHLLPLAHPEWCAAHVRRFLEALA
jgi:pimeloyl-[acyl-carrier protein] methyl ester esterase